MSQGVSRSPMGTVYPQETPPPSKSKWEVILPCITVLFTGLSLALILAKELRDSARDTLDRAANARSEFLVSLDNVRKLTDQGAFTDSVCCRPIADLGMEIFTERDRREIESRCRICLNAARKPGSGVVANELIEVAESLYQCGSYSEAMRAVDEALALDPKGLPTQVDGMALKAQIAAADKETELATKAIDAAEAAIFAWNGGAGEKALRRMRLYGAKASTSEMIDPDKAAPLRDIEQAMYIGESAPSAPASVAQKNKLRRQQKRLTRTPIEIRDDAQEVPGPSDWIGQDQPPAFDMFGVDDKPPTEAEKALMKMWLQIFRGAQKTENPEPPAPAPAF